MSRDRLATSSILNAASELIRTVANPWGALLFLLALPYRFLQIEFVERLVQLGGEARHYRTALRQTSILALAAFVLLVLGRAIFVRACRLSETGVRAHVGWSPFRLPAGPTFALLAVSLLFQSVAITFCFTLIALPIMTMFSGVAAATFEENRTPSMFRLLAVTGRHTREISTLVALTSIFCVAALLTWVNLFCAFALIFWLAQGAGGIDLTYWSTLVTPMNRLFDLLLTAGAFALLEPFWLAVNVIYVRRVDARRSGDDLRNWFRIIRASDEPERVEALP